MADIHQRRRNALGANLRQRELDALLVTDLTNIRYLTGFTGSNAALLVHAETEDASVFCTDGRYTTQVAAEVPDLPLVVDRASASAVLAVANAKPSRFGRTGFESGHVSVASYDQWLAAADTIELVKTTGLVEQLRAIKDPTEIEAIRMACAAADRALAELLGGGGLRAGRSERDVACELEGRMRDHGATEPSFPSIVAFGANSAIPHHQPTDTVLRDGDLVKLDYGATVNGYRSDMTRTLVFGKPADWQRDLYELVYTAQAAGSAAARANAEAAEVDRAARSVVERAGKGELFPHGLGHGVGLEIHEAPSLGKTAIGTLSAGMAITIEPGVYLSGRGGVRIEDTLVVRDNTTELLTLTSKELVVV